MVCTFTALYQQKTTLKPAVPYFLQPPLYLLQMMVFVILLLTKFIVGTPSALQWNISSWGKPCSTASPGFKLYVSTSNPPTTPYPCIENNDILLTFSASSLLSKTTFSYSTSGLTPISLDYYYYWKVVASSTAGDISSNIRKFKCVTLTFQLF